MLLHSMPIAIRSTLLMPFVLLLLAFSSDQHPVQVNQSDFITDENGTIIIAAEPGPETGRSEQSGPLAQFNERRRDMYFDDYSNKNVQVIDTSLSNNSISSTKVKSTLAVKNAAGTTGAMWSPSTGALPPTVTSRPEASQLPPNTTFLDSMQPQRPNLLLPKLEPSGRPSCVKTPDDTFCEVVDHYPKTAIKSEINFSVEQFLEIFGSKEIDGRTIVDVESDESVCRKVPRVIYPQMAKNQANQWVYVVNEVEYTQAVVAEICEKPGKPCLYMDNLPMGMYSRCKQKYSYKRLLALHPTEKRTYPDAFRFPSCCACYIKTVDDFLGRSGFRKIDKKVEVVETREYRSKKSPSPQINITQSSTWNESQSTKPTATFPTQLSVIDASINQTTIPQ